MTFSTSPLITADHVLNGSWPNNENSQPKCVKMVLPAIEDDEERPERRSFHVVTGGGSNRRNWAAALVNATQLAIIFEICRYGHKVAPNNNGIKNPDGSPTPSHWRITFVGARNDKTPINRLWMNTGAHEEVKSGIIFSDQTPESLRVTDSRKAIKDAREVCLTHCTRRAVEVTGDDSLATAYVANLRSLFALLDREAAR